MINNITISDLPLETKEKTLLNDMYNTYYSKISWTESEFINALIVFGTISLYDKTINPNKDMSTKNKNEFESIINQKSFRFNTKDLW